MAVFQPNQPDREADRAARNTAIILVFPYERIRHFVDRTARRIASYATCAERNQAMVEIITGLYEELSSLEIDDRLREAACIDFSKAVWPVVAEFDRLRKAQ